MKFTKVISIVAVSMMVLTTLGASGVSVYNQYHGSNTASARVIHRLHYHESKASWYAQHGNRLYKRYKYSSMFRRGYRNSANPLEPSKIVRHLANRKLYRLGWIIGFAKMNGHNRRAYNKALHAYHHGSSFAKRNGNSIFDGSHWTAE